MKLPKLALTHWEDASGDPTHSWSQGNCNGATDDHFVTIGWHSHSTSRTHVDANDLDAGKEHDFRGMLRLPKGMVVRRFTIRLPEEVRAYVSELLKRGKR